MSVLYCTVPDQVKYSTVIADEYRKITEKIDYWRADFGYIHVYWVRESSLVFFFFDYDYYFIFSLETKPLGKRC